MDNLRRLIKEALEEQLDKSLIDKDTSDNSYKMKK